MLGRPECRADGAGQVAKSGGDNELRLAVADPGEDLLERVGTRRQKQAPPPPSTTRSGPAIALVVGFAKLGAMTFLPTYLHYVHGVPICDRREMSQSASIWAIG